MVIVLNKADAADKDKVMGWIKNYESLLVNDIFQELISCLNTDCCCIWILGRTAELWYIFIYSEQIDGAQFGWVLQSVESMFRIFQPKN